MTKEKEAVKFDLPKFIAMVVTIIWVVTIVAQLVFTASGVEYRVDTEVHIIMGTVVGALWATDNKFFKDISKKLKDEPK